LTIVTAVMVPLAAVTLTGAAGLTSFAPPAGVTRSAAGSGAAGCDTDRSRDAATTLQPSWQRDVDDTTVPPSTARTASAAASQAPRTRRDDVNTAPKFGVGQGLSDLCTRGTASE